MDLRDSLENCIEVQAVEIEEPIWMERAGRFALSVLAHQHWKHWDFSLSFCDDSYMAELNMQYRGKEGATDVLSFPLQEGEGEWPEHEPFYAGDIVISLDTLAENAVYFSVAEEEELKRLIIHGILHLGGFDHSDNSPEQEMLVLQEQILAHLAKEKIY